MINKNDISKSLDARGLSLPEHEIDMIIDRISSVDGCLSSNYDDNTLKMLKFLAVIYLASEMSSRAIQSRSSPVGGSESFKLFDDNITSLYRKILSIDKHGCLSGIINNPNQSNVFFGVVDGL